jgi:carboxyl-terminal processing protease
MSSRSRWFIFLISTPLVIVAAVGGLLGASRSAPAQNSFRDLQVFQDVLQLIRTSYVESVETDKVLEGAMRGLAEGLDPASAYLTPEEVKAVDAGAPLPAGDVGVVVTRQFYLRVVGVRDDSPASRAGLRTGDFIRGIDGKSTREISAFTGRRLLAGAPGSKVQLTVLRGSAAEPHVVDLVREAPKGDLVSSKRLPGGEGYVRVASFTSGAAAAMRKQFDALRQGGATSAVIDLRGTADGTPDEGIAAARSFVKAGTLATLAGRGTERTVTSASAGDGSVAMPIVLLVSNGTANAAEIFAAALSGTSRADLVGEPTAGMAAAQHLVKLPENRGLWMTYARYLTTEGKLIHEHGLPPTVAVEEPNVAFGEVPPATDDMLAKAVAHLKQKKVA